jgi:hypothetical protein
MRDINTHIDFQNVTNNDKRVAYHHTALSFVSKSERENVAHVVYYKEGARNWSGFGVASGLKMLVLKVRRKFG